MTWLFGPFTDTAIAFVGLLTSSSPKLQNYVQNIILSNSLSSGRLLTFFEGNSACVSKLNCDIILRGCALVNWAIVGETYLECEKQEVLAVQ